MNSSYATVHRWDPKARECLSYSGLFLSALFKLIV